MLHARMTGYSGIMRVLVMICLVAATAGCRRKSSGKEKGTEVKAAWTTPDKPNVVNEEYGPSDGPRTPPMLSELPSIYFDFDASGIRRDQIQRIDQVVKTLRENPSRMLVLEGHADERGTTEYNLHLAERRANAVRDYLIRVGGILPDRLGIVSKGEEEPKDTGHHEEAWTKNRRVDFLYTD